ncbi:hypothetical protein Mapa_013877 [Marchantia paleacea]|nr:hypothetical protein Mapa_013877 [Marchantia paleacea]
MIELLYGGYSARTSHATHQKHHRDFSENIHSEISISEYYEVDSRIMDFHLAILWLMLACTFLGILTTRSMFSTNSTNPIRTERCQYGRCLSVYPLQLRC